MVKQLVRRTKSTLHNARKSLHEEKEAISDYTRRAKTAGSSSLKKVYKHARGEEREHKKLFAKWLRKRKK